MSSSAAFRDLPSVERLLGAASFPDLVAAHGRSLVVEAIRADLDELRAALRAGEPLQGREEPGSCAERVEVALTARAASRYPRAINGTGVVVHTGLGRAPLAPEAQAALQEGSGALVLEVERESGLRGQRDTAITAIVRELTGAPAACVVNNNAGATLISLAALAGGGRGVVVSRGQLVEIGGSYRIPDVCEQSGARMIEVGTTNRTHLRDYEGALDQNPDAAVLLRVHTSNFTVQGFTKEVETRELAELAQRPEHAARGVAVIDDLGSGCLIDMAPFGLPREPLVSESLAAGADLVTFSGDKLLGGPQAGVVVGTEEAVAKVRRHPLYRALRPGKLTLAALEATLTLYRDREVALRRIPVLRMISATPAELGARAQALCSALADTPGLQVAVEESASKIGGGSYAVEELPTRALALRPDDGDIAGLALRLRLGSPVVFSRIREGAVLIDPRTVSPDDESELVAAVQVAALGSTDA
jgi:L-seryl-tRNA(Ser) seleniumtransferase